MGGLAEQCRRVTMQNTHAGKAESYDLGRPAYPQAFYGYLYGIIGPDAVIADLGAGTGKVTQGFAERGSRVYAVEPDDDMRRILQARLSGFENCIVLGSCAEDTGIPAGAVDFIFCGNSYHWFGREQVIPEFRRILKPGADANVMIATLGGPPENQSPPFRPGVFIAKEFVYTLHQDWAMYLNGVLSASFSPNPGDEGFEEYCQSRQRHFERHGKDGKLKTEFMLSCMTGNVNDLIP